MIIKKNICVTICTRLRPKMLKRLLNSCVKITPDPRANLSFLVIENGPPGSAAEIVGKFAESLDISFAQEERSGLVFARNAAIESFLKTDAQWMASFDDDVSVSSDWLMAMLDAMDDFEDGICFAGSNTRIPCENETIWLPENKRQSYRTGKLVWDVTTANIIYKREVFAKDGFNLRFNPDFNFSGSEDTEMFLHMKDVGINIIWVNDADVSEPTPPERGTFKARSKRTIQFRQSMSRIDIVRFGRIRGTLLIFFWAFMSFLNVFSYGVPGLIMLVFNEKYGLWLVSRSIKFSIYVVGHLSALFVVQTLYKTPIGS